MTRQMQDSGQRREFTTGAVRDADTSKTRPDLISPYAIHREGLWMAKGAQKYTPRNWEKGIPFDGCIASLFRHLNAYQRGERGAGFEDHLAAIRANAGFLIHYEEMIEVGILPNELDDLPIYDPTELETQEGKIIR